MSQRPLRSRLGHHHTALLLHVSRYIRSPGCGIVVALALGLCLVLLPLSKTANLLAQHEEPQFGGRERPLPPLPSNAVQEFRLLTQQKVKSETTTRQQQEHESAVVISLGSTVCRSTNALVILAQKKHSTYGRDSLELLIKTLDLFRDNYLSTGNHAANVDVFLFHAGAFDRSDLVRLEARLVRSSGTSNAKGILKLVNLNNTVYWSLPSVVQGDNPVLWKGSEIYPVGYRHMCRFFGKQLWTFFDDLNNNNNNQQCRYRYIARLDEDSFLLSPIDYDMYDLMQTHDYVYGYRMCAYELDDVRWVKRWFKPWKNSVQASAQRSFDKDLCGFYTNFFVADLDFFLSQPVQQMVDDIDRWGFFYRKRFGDLLVHSLAVYTFAPAKQIHRFLDFTYQHATIDYFKDAEKECVSWGGIQGGYNDPNGEKLVEEFYHQHVVDKACPTANMTYLKYEDLSPTYAHLPDYFKSNNLSLKTVYAGRVELPHQGKLSG